MRPLTLQRLFLQCSLLAVVLFVVVVIALKLGAVPVSLYGLGRDLISVLLHQTKALTSDYGMIVIEIRLPRILLAIVVGASLSVAGTSYQALLRNPLADPYVLGVSMGAALGAILALIAEPHLALPVWLATLFTPLGAFLGAAATVAAVYFLGRREGQIDSGTPLLAGTISSSFLSAIIMFLLTTLTGHDDGREKGRADDTGEEQSAANDLSFAAAEEIYGRDGCGGAEERAQRSEERGEPDWQREVRLRDESEDGSEGGTHGNAENVGIGEGVAKQSLVEGSRHGGRSGDHKGG